jgi:hypothetical protein
MAKEIERLGALTRGMLTQAREHRKKTDRRLDAVEQAILELASALRDAGHAPDGLGLSLPSPSESRPSPAEPRSTIPA